MNKVGTKYIDIAKGDDPQHALTLWLHNVKATEFTPDIIDITLFEDNTALEIQSAPTKTVPNIPAVSEVNKLRKDLKSAVKRIEKLEDKLRLSQNLLTETVEYFASLSDIEVDYEDYTDFTPPYHQYRLTKDGKYIGVITTH